MTEKYSTIIIGSGISGLYCALKIAQSGGFVSLVTKSELCESNSYYAQGGMVAVLKENTKDSVELHIEDTLKAGAGLGEKNTVKFISENSDAVVRDLLDFGVDFDRDEFGNFTLTKEAAHSVCRILHSAGDATGREMEIALCKAVKSEAKIKIMENTMATKLLLKDNTCYGVEVLNSKGEFEIIYSNNVIVATGGVGQLYKYTTNPIGATGDGIALCYRAGAVLRDMEFVQFHPTALAIDDFQHHNRFLISEAVRGEGAKLCDKNRNRYMIKYDSREELAPRDIVARANFTEMKKNDSESVYLDASLIGEEKLLKRFPTIAKKCCENGIDITKDLIPVAPAAHYFMGGVKTDIFGKTSVENLYAIGEVASTGLHGANRLASNSLLECVVCAYYAAKDIKKENNICIKDFAHISEIKINPKNKNIKNIKKNLQTIMWNNVGIYRDEASLTSALNEVKVLEKEFVNDSTKESFELSNMITVAKLIIVSALNRKESRGGHFRTDYLQTNEKAYHSEIIEGEIYAK